ncbi:hypothetical protein [Rickettsiella endosymbiont of Dermanyssus gallinae]|uniref:hypothetical protein n=1 Tax=Rickettsiella endosymbiont of Dermanyssus gallinae TaxID=2856608 RepID=UPI001C529533|nr:hypothetical protein [Rickettsiella endosymbiont of Dermanyssus gallinae]
MAEILREHSDSLVMKRMRSFMKTQSITSKANTFYKRRLQGNIGTINFQKNKEGYPRVTINLGTYSLLLAKYSLASAQHPPQQKNKDWQTYSDTTHRIEQLFNEINPLIVDYRNPEIDKHISDEQLKINWLSQRGTEGACKLKYLCVLLKHSGKKEQLNTVLNEFGEFMQSHPEFIVLKKSYDRFMQEASNKQNISEEKPSVEDKQLKKLKP